jgi:hypothetical protein
MFQAYRARGPLFQRQLQANAAGVVCYAEQHCNASTSRTARGALVIVAPDASKLTHAWGKTYTRLCAKEFGEPDQGIVIGGRGTFNVRHVKAPALLLEPGFVSNPDFAAMVRTGEGQDALARVLVESIRQHFDGGLVGLSVGHMYRGTADKGAPVYEPPGFEDPAWDQEGEICDAVIESAAQMLGGYVNA